MISCLFDLTKLESYKSIRVLLVWMVDTLIPKERLCMLAAGLSSQGTVAVDAIVEAAATQGNNISSLWVKMSQGSLKKIEKARNDRLIPTLFSW